MAYIYRHIRKDTGEVFYIGIGKTKRRAHSFFERNSHWHNIVNKVGHIVEIIEDGLTWEQACEKEKQLIKEYGRADLGLGTLVNMTDGGDGIVGLIHTDNHRRKNSEANKGKPKSEEHRRKQKQRVVTDETKEKIRNSLSGRIRTDIERMNISKSKIGKTMGIDNPFFGKTHTPEAREKMRNSKIGKKLSEETKQKMRQSHTGKTHSHDEETKQRMSISAKLRSVKPPSRLGVKHSEETKQKMRETRLVKKNRKDIDN